MGIEMRLNAVVLVAVAALGATALGQRPPVRGSLDAMTVVPPTTGPAAQPALPAGHPMLPGQGDMGAGGMGMMMGGATSGAIRVNVTQGTKDGPALGKEPVTVQLFSKGVALKTYQTALDDKGVVELHDLPLETAFQPIITVMHGGAEQQFVGPPVTKMQPMVEMDMAVYETTAEKPAWTIGLRDIDVVAVDLGARGTGLQFTELLGGFNPTDRAWTGELVNGQRRTMTLPLAADAQDVQFGPGFAEAGATVVEHAVVRGKTMLPGATQYVLGYTIAPRAGKVTAAFTAPADTTLFALYLPGDAKIETMTGLEVGKAGGAKEQRQLLKSRGIKAGETVSVVLSGFKAPVKVEPLPQVSDLHLPVPGAGTSTKPESKP